MPGFSNTWTMNFQISKQFLEKTEGSEIKLATSAGSWKEQESSRKTSTSALLCQSLWLCGSQSTVENSERDGHTRPPDLPLEKLCAGQEATVRTGHGTTDCFQIEKGVRQGCILSPCLFNFYAEYIMKILGWKKHKLESRLPGEISITSDMQMALPLWQKVKTN